MYHRCSLENITFVHPIIQERLAGASEGGRRFCANSDSYSVHPKSTYKCKQHDGSQRNSSHTNQSMISAEVLTCSYHLFEPTPNFVLSFLFVFPAIGRTTSSKIGDIGSHHNHGRERLLKLCMHPAPAYRECRLCCA